MVKKSFFSTFLKSSDIVQYLAFFLVIWLAYFIKFRAFGLYEDDYWYIGKPANMNFGELLDLLKNNVFNIEGGQGRIIGFTVPQLLAFISFKLGGISGVYILGSFVILLNAVLFYRFGLKIFPKYIAGIATILFILNPADTTKPLLIHILQLQISVTFVLLALNVYLNGRRIPAFVLAFCSLLTYENAYLPFLAAPLFAFNWDKKLIRRFIVHLIAGFSLILLIFVVRKLMGESRIAELETAETIKRVLISLIVGPVVSIGSFFVAMYEVVISVSVLKWILPAGIILFILWHFITEKVSYGYNQVKTRLVNLPGLKIEWESYETSDRIILLIIAGLFMLICSYLFAFTHYPPVVLHGRSSSVHLAGSVSGSIVAAAIIYLIHFLVSRNNALKHGFNVLLIIFMSILLSKGLLIQNDFKKSWNGQVQFWNEITNNTPDIKNNTIVLVDVDDNMYDIAYIITYSWALPEGYNQIFRFDESWEYPPKAVIPGITYENDLQYDEQGIYFEPVYPFVFEDREKVYLEDKNVIYIDYNDGQAARVDTVFRCDSVAVATAVKPVGEIPQFKLNEVGKLFLKK
ncbi:MAG: hypothetical protein JW894_08445 [Bacteroidales bacterium]|nr:hypothetical protein [Bacteroidales bacterium]